MHLPGPLRAAVGLAATAADELKNLPDRAVELPMLAVSTALQMSLRAQQRYARLAARGEQVLNREEPSEEPPAWATFDEPVSVDELRKAALTQLDSLVDGGTADESLDDLLGGRESGNGRSAGRMFEELFGVDDPAGGGDAAVAGSTGSTGGTAEATDATVTPITQAPGAAAKTGATPRKSARKTSRKTATRKTATKSAPVTTAEKTEKTEKTETAQKAAPAKKSPRKAAPPPASDATNTTDEPGKPVNKPRHTTPSKFDDADDS